VRRADPLYRGFVWMSTVVSVVCFEVEVCATG